MKPRQVQADRYQMKPGRSLIRALRLPMIVATSLSVLAGVGLAATVTTVAGQTSAQSKAAAPMRVVAIGGAVTEILYALGLEDRIVGVDTTSLYPPEAMATKPNVGYMRQLSPEGVLGLNPQMILAVAGSGPKDTLTILENAGIPFHLIAEAHSEDGILDKIRAVARLMHAEKRGACLADAVGKDIAAMRALRGRIDKPQRVMFIMSMVNGKINVAGRATAANAIIQLAGGVNAVDSYDGYKAITDEAIGAARPDVILTMQRGGPDAMTADTVFANPAFALTPAAARKALIAMDGLYLLGFGPRTAEAAHDLAARLYPDVIGTAAWTSAVRSADCRN